MVPGDHVIITNPSVKKFEYIFHRSQFLLNVNLSNS